MIILSIHAENFRKYTQLRLDNLPERGLLAVVGGNESGKSSIGDAIQFGLFGRTTQIPPEEAAKLIHWGTDKASVSLRLQHRGHEYRLARSINSAGETAATLFSTEEETTLADTPEGVERQLKALLGYHYDAFAKAFYWSQQNSSSREGDSDALRALAGLKEHARLSSQLEHEQQDRLATLEELDAKRQHTAGAIEALHIDEGQLPHLNSIVTDLDEHQQRLLLLEEKLDKETVVYPNNLRRFQQASQRSRKISRWTKIVLLIFLITLLVGLFLLFTPEWGTHFLTAMTEGIRDLTGRTSIRLASIAALIGACLLVYGWYVDVRHLRPLQRQARNLASVMDESYQVCTQPVSRLLQTDSTDYLLAKHLELPESSNSHADMAAVPDWKQAALHYQAKALYVHSAADTLHTGLTNRNQELQNYQAMAKADIQTEQTHLQQRAQLQQLLQQQEHDLEHERREQVVASTAIDLLQRDASRSIGRFNQMVQARCPEFLQRFTQSHYKSLEILPDFSLKVLSEEKGDFLDFNEISTGTQRQVALAMRITLANALTDATKADAQMIFLDEPFAFFDPERASNTLQSLQETSKGAVSQIWLTAQTKPEGISLAQVIPCPQGNPVLKL
ncbi:AAA family ATPase [Candidatus Thiothrix sp. Deng01]|uniref:AAA family ATPase n=1 Tax=Candidatus Thiothrix phosphatis TaxID=3112415 RepID=A0ABU6D0R8_9GAMM|nr:AAA family ATPase [Candidatus Thiothrix sp. Deng01]MEB4592659.1 AAA family ATPase [Candidatus Thiothrix sp. Deng01]